MSPQSCNSAVLSYVSAVIWQYWPRVSARSIEECGQKQTLALALSHAHTASRGIAGCQWYQWANAGPKATLLTQGTSGLMLSPQTPSNFNSSGSRSYDGFDTTWDICLLPFLVSELKGHNPCSSSWELGKTTSSDDLLHCQHSTKNKYPFLSRFFTQCQPHLTPVFFPLIQEEIRCWCMWVDTFINVFVNM